MGVVTPRSGPHAVHTVHRVGAVAIGAFLLLFAAIAFARGAPMMTTEGIAVLGLFTNGLLAVISVIVGLVLVAAAVRGGPLASTVSVVVGALFLLSGLGNLLVLGTAMNMLAFRLSNVVFSLAVGLVLVILGSYGRLTGGLPDESPYHRADPPGSPALTVAERDERAAGRAVSRELAAAERAEALHRATPDQRRRLAEVGRHGSHDDRRRAWQASGEHALPSQADRSGSTDSNSSDGDR